MDKSRTILTFNGSGRRAGNTARVLDLLEERIAQRAGGLQGPTTSHEAIGGQIRRTRLGSAVGAQIERVNIAEHEIKPCRGCRLCFDRGEDACPLHDDVLSIRDRIRGADCVVLASPVYVNDVSGSMKTLIDRLAFVCHRPAFFSTPAALVTTTGGSPSRHTIRTLQGAHMSWGGRVVGSGSFKTGALTPKEEIAERYSDRIDRLAGKILDAALRSTSPNPGFMSLMMFAIQQASWRRVFAGIPNETVDELHWRDNGWLDRSTTYFCEHRAPAWKVAPARLVGRIIARFVG